MATVKVKQLVEVEVEATVNGTTIKVINLGDKKGYKFIDVVTNEEIIPVPKPEHYQSYQMALKNGVLTIQDGVWHMNNGRAKVEAETIPAYVGMVVKPAKVDGRRVLVMLTQKLDENQVVIEGEFEEVVVNPEPAPKMAHWMYCFGKNGSLTFTAEGVWTMSNAVVNSGELTESIEGLIVTPGRKDGRRVIFNEEGEVINLTIAPKSAHLDYCYNKGGKLIFVDGVWTMYGTGVKTPVAGTNIEAGFLCTVEKIDGRYAIKNLDGEIINPIPKPSSITLAYYGNRPGTQLKFDGVKWGSAVEKTAKVEGAIPAVTPKGKKVEVSDEEAIARTQMITATKSILDSLKVKYARTKSEDIAGKYACKFVTVKMKPETGLTLVALREAVEAELGEGFDVSFDRDSNTNNDHLVVSFK